MQGRAPTTYAWMAGLGVALAAAALSAQNPWYTVNPYDNLFHEMNVATGITVTSFPLTVPGDTVEGANGLTQHPITGTLYAVVELVNAGTRNLVTVDPVTQTTTHIGAISDRMSSLAFDASGTLWGLSGSLAVQPEVLWTIDLNTAVATLALVVGPHNDGECLAFHPPSGLLYRASGYSTPFMETIDPVTLVRNPLPAYTPPTFFEMTAMVWDAGAGNFLGSSWDEQCTVTAAGSWTGTGVFFDHELKGILEAVPPAPPPTCNLNVAAGVLSGDITVDVDVLTANAAAVDITLEWSDNGGVTWNLCTMAGGSPSPNPAMGVPLGVTSFLWDSRGDGAALLAAGPIDLQATVDDGVAAAPGICAATAQVDNTALCTGVCGDCDQNGAGPDILDALVAAQIGALIVTPTPAQSACCDTNASGTVDVIDALLMAQAGAQLPVTPVCP